MTDTPQKPELSDIPDAVSEPKRRFSVQLVWIIPIVAALIGLSLAVKAFIDRGETITITFKTGEGMEARKTKIKYKDVADRRGQGACHRQGPVSRDRDRRTVEGCQGASGEGHPVLGGACPDLGRQCLRARHADRRVLHRRRRRHLDRKQGRIHRSRDAARRFPGHARSPVCPARRRHRLTRHLLADLLPSHAGGTGDRYRTGPGRQRGHHKGFRPCPIRPVCQEQLHLLACQRHRADPQCQRREDQHGIHGLDPSGRHLLPDPAGSA